MNDKCPIWGTLAAVDPPEGDRRIVYSPRAGGKYWISGSAEAEVMALTNAQKLCLTTWLCDQRAAGTEIPKINTAILPFIRVRKRLPVSRRLSRALLLMSDLLVGQQLSLTDDKPEEIEKAAAKTESVGGNEIRNLFRLLKEAGYIEGRETSSGLHAVPTINGWMEIERLTSQQVDSSQAFVAMWFNPSTDEAFEVGIEPAVAATGHKALRIDSKEHSNKIDDEIIAEIRRSRFLIADFTCQPKDIRGGVYYEAGFAQGIGIPVIWTCSKHAENDLHFDTRQYAHIMWDTPQDLFEKLKNRIGAVIGDGPLPKA